MSSSPRRRLAGLVALALAAAGVFILQLRAASHPAETVAAAAPRHTGPATPPTALRYTAVVVRSTQNLAPDPVGLTLLPPLNRVAVLPDDVITTVVRSVPGPPASD
ncbi:MAG: hypothetical protein QOI61_2056 [Actinomycetota bacterium]|jgi:glucose/arabinose dehydrogenase